MTAQSFLAFAALNFAYCLAPGPNAALIVAVSARNGARVGSAVLFGVCLAEVFWALVAVVVVLGVFDLGELGTTGLTLFGAGGLMVLGTMILVVRQRHEDLPISAGIATEPPVAAPDSSGKAMFKGTFVGMTNPISLVFFVSVAPGFLPTGGITSLDALWFVLAAVLSCGAAHAPYLGASGLRHRRFVRGVESLCGIALCWLGASTLVSAITVSG